MDPMHNLFVTISGNVGFLSSSIVSFGLFDSSEHVALTPNKHEPTIKIKKNSTSKTLLYVTNICSLVTHISQLRVTVLFPSAIFCA